MTMHYNTATMRRCLSDATNNNVPTFCRTAPYLPRVGGGGRHGSSSSTTASGRQSTDLTFRRTPSPQTRKTTADVVGETTSPSTLRTDARRVSNPASSGGARKISLDDNVFPLSCSRNSSGGLMSSIQEDASPCTTPLSAPAVGQFHMFQPRRSVSASLAQYGSTRKRTSYSKVLVMPSVARISHGLEASPPPPPP